ncbi:hypothetical protein [Cohnella hashimotonis]|uniref:Uncharacterized protein n=1 Tax=Cohnella hashimotonis TaxID=2826895 RepID=A0ABT6TJE7_9BACL|nr:hypothetical protein [Cohnella hashimotonis]MDI4646963.1 hypothetical protein [Cohnella hashimotonis]
MDDSGYAFATLEDEQLDELKRLEQELTTASGHAVTLIAYEKKDAE